MDTAPNWCNTLAADRSPLVQLTLWMLNNKLFCLHPQEALLRQLRAPQGQRRNRTTSYNSYPRTGGQSPSSLPHKQRFLVRELIIAFFPPPENKNLKKQHGINQYQL